MREYLGNKMIYLIGGLSTFLAPIASVMIAVGVLIMIDFIMGIIAARKTGDKINSKKMSNTLIKMLVYQLLIITSHLIELYLVPWLPILKITLSFIGIIEFLSIGENFTKITKKNFVKYIKDFIQSKLKSNDIPDIEELNGKEIDEMLDKKDNK